MSSSPLLWGLVIVHASSTALLGGPHRLGLDYVALLEMPYSVLPFISMTHTFVLDCLQDVCILNSLRRYNVSIAEGRFVYCSI